MCALLQCLELRALLQCLELRIPFTLFEPQKCVTSKQASRFMNADEVCDPCEHLLAGIANFSCLLPVY